MSSENTEFEDGPAPDPFEAELVAYLDGELDAAAARRVEAKLASDPAARARADEL
jgi:anti-sigma factor RsiW